MSDFKDSNPKDAIGIRKVPAHVVPRAVVMEAALGMLEGHAKGYRSHNFRVIGVRASVYFDAVNRHLDAWWEGQDIDPGSGLSHVTKAISSLLVLRDAMLNEFWTDDRPPRLKHQDWVDTLNAKAGEILDKYPEPVEPYTQVGVAAEPTVSSEVRADELDQELKRKDRELKAALEDVEALRATLATVRLDALNRFQSPKFQTVKPMDSGVKRY